LLRTTGLYLLEAEGFHRIDYRHIAIGRTPVGLYHAVVMRNGAVIYDPAPKPVALGPVELCILFARPD